MLMRGRIAKQYRNYGELLYIEGLTKKKNQEKLIEKKRKDDEVKELSELTGIPKIRFVHYYLKFFILICRKITKNYTLMSNFILMYIRIFFLFAYLFG